MNQEDLNALMRNPWEAAKKPRPQPLPECPQCGERYCGDGIAFCTECANTVTPNAALTGERSESELKAQLCNKQEIDMETMSQFASEKDLWKARCLRFATALVDVMDGVQDHHIGDETGLPQDDCARIAKARADARTLVYNAALTGNRADE